MHLLASISSFLSCLLNNATLTSGVTSNLFWNFVLIASSMKNLPRRLLEMEWAFSLSCLRYLARTAPLQCKSQCGQWWIQGPKINSQKETTKHGRICDVHVYNMWSWQKGPLVSIFVRVISMKGPLHFAHAVPAFSRLIASNRAALGLLTYANSHFLLSLHL